jgi:hypothetical protein
VPIEQRSRDAFQGVAKVDEETDPTTRLAQLVAGDGLAILLFAAIGRGNHGEGLELGEVFATAMPFLIGWFATSGLTGTYGDDAKVRAGRSDGKTPTFFWFFFGFFLVFFGFFLARASASPADLLFCRSVVLRDVAHHSQGTKTGPAAIAAAKGVALGVPAGIALRALSKGAIPPKPFVVVTLVANAVLLVGWRSWFASSGGGGGGVGGKGGNKRGNPLEFLNLLMSLTKRW